jgi:hypothetical protein
MAFINVEGNTGGKDLTIECGTVKVSLMTQTTPHVDGEISPKGMNRVVGVICGFGNVFFPLLAGYTWGVYSDNVEQEDRVSVVGEPASATHFLVFGY